MKSGYAYHMFIREYSTPSLPSSRCIDSTFSPFIYEIKTDLVVRSVLISPYFEVRNDEPLTFLQSAKKFDNG